MPSYFEYSDVSLKHLVTMQVNKKHGSPNKPQMTGAPLDDVDPNWRDQIERLMRGGVGGEGGEYIFFVIIFVFCFFHSHVPSVFLCPQK